jgi:hypothetical protein
MLIAISGSAAAPQAAPAAHSPALAASATAPAATSRTTEQDTATISPAGHQASQASVDRDSDGDSH